MLNIKKEKQKDDPWSRLKHPFAARNSEILKPKFQPVYPYTASNSDLYDQELDCTRGGITIPFDADARFYQRTPKKATLLAVSKVALDQLVGIYGEDSVPVVAYRHHGIFYAAVVPGGFGEISMNSENVLGVAAIAQEPKPKVNVATIGLMNMDRDYFDGMNSLLIPSSVGQLRKDVPMDDVLHDYPGTPVVKIR